MGICSIYKLCNKMPLLKLFSKIHLFLKLDFNKIEFSIKLDILKIKFYVYF